MFEKIKGAFCLVYRAPTPKMSLRTADDRDAGIPVPVRGGPQDRGSSVSVAEPDDDDQ